MCSKRKKQGIAVAVRLSVEIMTQPLWIWRRALAWVMRVSHSHHYLQDSQPKVFGSIHIVVTHAHVEEHGHARTKYVTCSV